MNLRTVSTKAQDGPQHPGADALEILPPFVDSGGKDVYIYMTDIYRGFPYEWPGADGPARLADFKEKIKKQVEQVLTMGDYQDNVVYVPFNEPEGNMFGTGKWSYNSDLLAERPEGLLRGVEGGLPPHQGPGPGRAHRGPEHLPPLRPGQGLPAVRQGQ